MTSFVKQEAAIPGLDDLDMIESLLNMTESTTACTTQIDEIRQPDEKRRKVFQDIDVNTMAVGGCFDARKIEKRNARERNRVRVVNDSFDELRRLVLASEFCMRKIIDSNEQEAMHGKKLSKVRILRLAIEYIEHLSSIVYEQSTYEYPNVFDSQYSQSDCLSIEDFDLDIPIMF